jgi:hypothetical protein
LGDLLILGHWAAESALDILPDYRLYPPFSPQISGLRQIAIPGTARRRFLRDESLLTVIARITGPDGTSGLPLFGNMSTSRVLPMSLRQTRTVQQQCDTTHGPQHQIRLFKVRQSSRNKI